jgi:hypothetical protein
MTAKENDNLKCPDAKCGCEVKVTKASSVSGPLHCCCGKAMTKKAS